MSSPFFRITGGTKLEGTLVPQGAKNEVLQILCATLLTDEPVTIYNVPNIVDVRRLISLIKGLGVKVEKLNPETYRFTANNVDLSFFASEEYQRDAKQIRGSVMLIGAMLARFGKAFLPKPGGDKIGRRRLDTHFHGLIKLGAKFRSDNGNDNYYLDADDLEGKYILMDEISVTGTANMIFAALGAKGTTTIFNAACEPYVQQLCKMLKSMGAEIDGIGSNLLKIQGPVTLHGTEHHVMPDMIEIGSFIGLAALTGKGIRIQDGAKADLGNILPVFEKMGVTIETQNQDLFVPEHPHYKISTFIDHSILTVYDAPWPGFTPDLMSILIVLATQAKGSVLIHQKMFESRLFFVDKLIDMGAQIILCDPHRATVIGLNREYPLRGINMVSPDIRAGVALLLAALTAEGTSTIYNINQIDRGYQNIDGRLKNIGAQIERVFDE